MEEDEFNKLVEEFFPGDVCKINAKNMADPDSPRVVLEQELHDIFYQQDRLSLNIIVVFKETTKISVRANLNDTVADLKRKMEKDLGISTSKQVLSFKSTVLRDDQSIFSIHGIENGSHIELTFCDDDTGQLRSLSGKAKLELIFSTLPTAPTTTYAADPTFTDASASVTRRASSSQAATKQSSKLGGQGTENNPANVSIIVESNERMLFVRVNKSHKVSVLRDILAEAQKNDPTLAGLIPEHYLFTKEGCMIVEDISFLRNSVKHNDMIQIVSQPGKVGPPEKDGKLIKIFVSRRTSMITDKMVMEIVASKTAGALKEELAKHRRLKELGFTIPTYYSFWLFHEQATTGHLFQLVDTTSLSLQRVQKGDTVFVVPKDPLKLKVRSSWTGMTVHVQQVKATEAVGKLRKMLQRIKDKMIPLPSQPYDFEYKGERIIDERKPFYWHHIVGDDELMIHIVPSLL